MNRKLLAVAAVAAALALLAGAAVGRNLLSSAEPTKRADVVRFKDEVSKISIAYPGTWRRLPTPQADPEVALLVAAGRDASTVLLIRVASVGLEPVTRKSLPIVRRFTDDLLAADKRAKLIGRPEAVELGGLPGYRYRYSFGSGESAGAHDHYFLFKSPRMIQLVFQTQPPARLEALTPVFERIAATFRGRET